MIRLGSPEVRVDRDTITAALPIVSSDGEPAPPELTIGVVDPHRLLGDPANVDASVTPFVPIGVVTALVLGHDLDLSGAVSVQQAGGAGAAGGLLGRWLDRPAPAITTRVDRAPIAAAPGVGLFFTRGVDSWASLLEHRDHVTHLLFLDGVEPRMSDAARMRVLADHERTAREVHLPLLVLTTNARAALEPFASWEHLHGAVLASAALLLAPLLGEVLIASSHAADHPGPWGTHAQLDPLWSTPAVRFRHDGAGRTRWQKTECVAACDLALESLHVCWMGGGDRNCGRCHKCLVTMTALAEIGVLDRCRRFDAPLDIDAVVRLERLRPGRGSNVVDLLRHLPPGSDLAQAWAHVVEPSMLAGTPHAM